MVTFLLEKIDRVVFELSTSLDFDDIDLSKIDEYINKGLVDVKIIRSTSETSFKDKSLYQK